MSSNRVGTNLSPILIRVDGETTWNELVEKQVEKHKALKILTCHAFSSTSKLSADDQTKTCPCGRLLRSHSFEGQPRQELATKTTFIEREFLTPKPLDVYGQLGQFGNGARFIRCYSGDPSVRGILADLIIEDVSTKPSLLISCFGGAKGFKMTDRLETEFKTGISQAAAAKGVWLLTTGLNSGVSKLVGQDVHRSSLLSKNPPKPTLIGINKWGALTERTKKVLKWRSSPRTHLAAFRMIAGHDVPITLDWSEKDTLDKYHTHFLLLDNGRVEEHLDDRPRSGFVDVMCEKTKCQALTIIIEGGQNTLEVIENDLKKSRPVIIIHGSGRLANVLGTLIELHNGKKEPNNDDIKHHLTALAPELEVEIGTDYKKTFISRIKEIMVPEYRKYLNVFNLERDSSLTDMMFRAMNNVNATSRDDFFELAVSWNHVHLIQGVPQLLREQESRHPDLFQQALIEDRPIFVDYFLRQNYNPLDTTAYEKEQKLSTTGSVSASSLNKITMFHAPEQANAISEEYKLRAACAFEIILRELYGKSETLSGHWTAPKTIEQLDTTYKKLIGPYTKSLYFEQSTRSRLSLIGKTLGQCVRSDEENEEMPKSSGEQPKSVKLPFTKPFDKQEMLRELFVWSVCAGRSNIAFVLLLQIESRMTAALIGMRIAQRISHFANHLDQRHKFAQQAKEYEEYARACITACYEHNERLACQVLVRENPLFGDVTCMQVAVASRSIPFINTNCFMEVLNREWFGQMTDRTTASLKSQVSFLISLMTCGFAAPVLMEYDQVETDDKKLQDYSNNASHERSKRWQGIEDQRISNLSYWRKFLYFHSAPAVKMSYDFLIYLWFLLVFSYMMLFDMRLDEDRSHWTKIYLIVVVSTMVVEELRRLAVNFHTQMMERFNESDSWLALIYAMPYILFYVGIICYYRSVDRPQVFTAARIILAIDLELWYLHSLRFVSAIKLLGPKLVMIRYMTRDLAAFIYIIFVCIAAYGVVSCALTMYATLDFTANSIFTSIFYRPYWLLYSVADDEISHLDGIISNATDSESVAEATVNHVLLAFHMIFINILILNLLIAVFNFTINYVQEKNEFFWRYQRYELTRNYFEKPILAHPPLSLIAYVIWLVQVLVFRGTAFRLFKILRTTSDMDVYWTEFEEAATYEHARKLVDDKYRAKDQTTVGALNARVDALVDQNERIRTDLGDMKNQTSKSLKWVMKAMARVKMSHDMPPIPENEATGNA